MPNCYDRDGSPLTIDQWAALFERPEQKRVAETLLPDGQWVSTVWIGFDPGYGQRSPLIFETMVFPTQGDFTELDCDRYPTEAEAVAGHDAMVAKWMMSHHA